MRVFLLLLAASTAALADDAALLRCRAIADGAARLACYDAIAVPSRAPAASPSSPAPAASAGPAANTAPMKPGPEDFGFEERRAESPVQSVESRIEGRFEGWEPQANIRFANGQVWQVMDGSSAALWLENPKVRVRRGALGAFYLEIEGSNRSPRVRRLR